MPTYSKSPYSVVVSNEGYIQVKPGDSLSKYSWAIYGNYTTLDVFARRASNGQPTPIVNKDLIYAGETLIYTPSYKNGAGGAGQIGIGSPTSGGSLPSLGSSLPATSAAAAAPAISIRSLNKAGIDKGAWKFDVRLNGVLADKQRVLLTFGPMMDFVFLDANGAYGRDQLETLLEIFAYSRCWGQTLQCKAVVAEMVPWTPGAPLPDGARTLRTFASWTRYPIIYGFRILSESNMRNIAAPVQPIDTCSWGREMLLRIGQVQPRLGFVTENGDYAGSWLTQPIGGRNYLKRGFQDGGQLVTEQFYNGMDCTTYMLAGFGLDISVTGLFADDIVGLLPVRDIGANNLGGTDEVRKFFETHMLGNFIAFHHTHFVAVIDGIVREFFIDANGYLETPIAQRTFPTGNGGGSWSIRQF